MTRPMARKGEEEESKFVYGLSPFLEQSQAAQSAAAPGDENRMLLHWERNIIPRVRERESE